MQPFLVKLLKADIRDAENLRGRLVLFQIRAKQFHLKECKNDRERADRHVENLRRMLRLAENGAIQNGR